MSSFVALVGKMQCALDINRYFSHNCSSEGRIGKERKGERGRGKRAKRVNESKVTLGQGTRDTGQEGDTRRAFVCFVCSVVVVVVAISNCQLSMNLQKYKQTVRQGQAKGRGVRCAVQLKRLTVLGEEVLPRNRLLACSLALSCPMPVNILLVCFLGRAQATAR